MEALRARVGRFSRDGKRVFYSYVDGKYFEHSTKEEVRAHHKEAEDLAEKYKNLSVDAQHRFLQENVFAGFPDLNTGIDSPLIPHFSPAVFETVLERCAAHNVKVTGIEICDITRFPTEFLGMHGAAEIPDLISKYRNVPGITFAGFYDARSNLSEKDRLELDRRDIDLDVEIREALASPTPGFPRLQHPARRGL